MDTIATSSHIELSSEMFTKNLKFIRSRISSGAQLSAVIKGNAYGHGIDTFVPMAEREGIKHFSVYGIEEAFRFHEVSSTESMLMIMGFISKGHLPWVIRNGYEFFVYDLRQLKAAIDAAIFTGEPAKVHIEMETGMNRTGIDAGGFKELVALLKENAEHLICAGVATHLAGAENIANKARILGQIKRFNQFLKKFEKEEIHFKYRHAACSAAALRYPETQFDLVRIGILLYGFWPNRETLIAHLAEVKRDHDPLTSILSWKSQVMTIKEVPAGEYIGYGTTYLANQPTKIAIIPVGYAYGYARSLSNQGRVLIHGKRVPVIGLVNMNMMAIDVTHIENVSEEDEVVLIGFQGENRITVASFGELSSQLNYELLARLPHNIPRTTI
jgi:alanine racemase